MDLTERLACVMGLEPSSGISDIEILTYSSNNAALLKGRGIPESFRGNVINILNRVTIYENPERTVYHCCIHDFPSLYPTDEVVWHLVSILFSGLMIPLSDRIFLIHGAMMTDGTEHVALVGSSGAGKTTAATRIPSPFRCEADDMIAAIPKDGGYVFHPFPTWSRLFPYPAQFVPTDSNQQFTMHRLFFIEQADRDSVVPIDKADAIQRLVQSSLQFYLPYWRDLSLAEQLTCKSNVLMHATKLVESVECQALEISKNGRYWEKIW